MQRRQWAEEEDIAVEGLVEGKNISGKHNWLKQPRSGQRTSLSKMPDRLSLTFRDTWNSAPTEVLLTCYTVVRCLGVMPRSPKERPPSCPLDTLCRSLGFRLEPRNEEVTEQKKMIELQAVACLESSMSRMQMRMVSARKVEDDCLLNSR